VCGPGEGVPPSKDSYFLSKEPMFAGLFYKRAQSIQDACEAGQDISIYVCVYMNVYICMYTYGGEGLRGLRESHTYVNIYIHTIYICTHIHIIVHTHMNVHIWRGEAQGTERKKSKSCKT